MRSSINGVREITPKPIGYLFGQGNKGIKFV